MPSANGALGGPREKPVLPVDQVTLDALSALRAPLDPAQRPAAVTALVEALPSLTDPSHTGLSYVLRRLVEGVAVSGGGARENMSLALAAVARCLAGEKKTVDAAVDAVTAVYGAGGSFVTDYTGAERERALGCLTACVAVASAAREIAGARGGAAALGCLRRTPAAGPRQRAAAAPSAASPLSGQAALALLTMLQAVARANNGKWALGVPCVHAVRDVLPLVSRVDYDDLLAKPLLKWCRERASAADGVALTMVLHVDFGLVSASAMSSIYPKPALFSTALLDCFEQGFPLWSQKDIVADQLPAVPLQWTLALQFAAKDSAASRALVGEGGVATFWADVVVTMLVLDSSSAEKKTLAVALFPHALSMCASVKETGRLLTDDMAAFLASVLGGRGRAAFGVRKRKLNNDMVKRLNAAALALGKGVLDVLREKQRNGLKNTGAWVRGLFMWAVQSRLFFSLFRGDSLRFGLSLMSDVDVDLLFQDMVLVLARPSCSVERSGAVRSEAVKFLSSLASHRKSLALDTVKVFALYGAFDHISGDGREEHIPDGGDSQNGRNKGSSSASQGCTNRKTSDVCSIRALHRHRGKESPPVSELFGSIAPMPQPEMTSQTSELLFRQVVALLSSGSHASKEQASGTPSPETLVKMTLDFVKEVVDTQDARQVSPRSSNLHLKPSVDGVLENLRSVPIAFRNHAVVRSCGVLAQYMALYLFDPLMVKGDTEAAVSPATYARVLKLMTTCLQTLTKEEEKGSAGDVSTAGSANENEDEERDPTATEQMVYILATVCRQHSAALRQIAAFAFEAMAENVDCAVAAVLFDLLEADVQSGSVGDEDEAHDDDQEGDELGDSGDEEDANSDESSEEGSDESHAKKQKILGDAGDGLADRDLSDGNDSAEDGSDEDDLADMMLDDEDPTVLEAYDKHLSNHMQLLKVEKKENRRARLLAARRASSSVRILDLVELLARRLRLKLEMDGESTVSTSLVVFDLLVRIVDFCYGEDANGLQHISKFLGIFNKHLDRPLSSFPSSSLTEAEAIELLKRLFDALKASDRQRKTSAGEVRMVSHTLTFICHAAPARRAVTEFAAKGYRDLWAAFVSPGNRFVGIPIFSTAVARVPSVASMLVTLALETSSKVEVSSGIRSLAVQVLHAYVPSVRALQPGEETIRIFWTGISDILVRSSSDHELGGKLWKHGVGLGDFLRIVDAGLQGGDISSVSPQKGVTDNAATNGSPGSHVAHLLSILKIPRPLRKKMNKTIKSIYSTSPPGTDESAE